MAERTITTAYSPLWWSAVNKRGEDAHTIFENFNSGKIPLTKSELLKALFMNPNHYTNGDTTKDAFDAIKTRQIMLGAQWDEMERQLHNADFRHFIPHAADYIGTRLDAVFDLFVYTKVTAKFDMDDPLYAYRQLNEEIIEKLKQQPELPRNDYYIKKERLITMLRGTPRAFVSPLY